MANSVINWFKNKITFLNNSLPAISGTNLNSIQENIESDFSNFVQGELINNIPISNDNLKATNLKAAIDELAEGTGGSAAETSYNNSSSQLSATTVQAAIDEVNGKIKTQSLVTERSSGNVNTEISALATATKTITLTKSGYYPVGLAGATTSASNTNIVSSYISASASGTCTVTVKVGNSSANANSTTLTAYVMWAKLN